MTQAAMTIDDLVSQRRSIRSYRPEVPPDDWIDTMVAAAIKAPSPSNSQPVRFVRIRSRATRDRLAKNLKRGYVNLRAAAQAQSRKLKYRVDLYYRFSVFMNTAPVLMAVGTLRKPEESFSSQLSAAGILNGTSRSDSDLALTAGIALSAFLLKGTSLGVGACILTAPLVFIPAVESLIEAEGLNIRCFVTAGIPDECPAPIPRKPFCECYRTV